MIEDLKAFCTIYIVTFWVILFSANRKIIQNWKQKLIIWNVIFSAEISNLLNCCLFTYILGLVFLYCSNINPLVLLTWVCSCIMFEYFGWSVFIFCSNFRDQPLMSTLFVAKLVLISGIFLNKVSLMYEDSFPIPLLRILKYTSLSFIQNSMKSSWKELIPFRACHDS